MTSALTLVVFLQILSLASAACGDPGQAYFAEVEGTWELSDAVSCVLRQTKCHKLAPEAARGENASDASKAVAYYGANMSHWCTGMITDFSTVGFGKGAVR